MPPFSLVFQTPEGNALYSRDVNRITCVARQSPALLWLGTRLGLKILDRRQKTVRHYTRRDGLPGDYVEAVAADAAGVFCVVRVGGLSPDRLALCAFDARTGRWRTLDEVSAPVREPSWDILEDGLAYARRGESRIALTPARIVFAPSMAGRDTETILHVFDRRSGTTRGVGWDPGLRTDHNLLGITFLWCDDRRAYLGTSAGLLSLDLNRSGKGTWRRFLPEMVIEAGTVAPDGKGGTRLWLAGHQRQIRRDRNVPPRLVLWAFSPESGEVTAMPRPERIAGPKGFDPYSGSTASARAVYVAGDGGVWVTWSGGIEFAPPSGGFARYDPATRTWRAYGLNGLSVEEITALWQPRPDGAPLTMAEWMRLHTPASGRIVPDGAVLPLARTLRLGPSAADPRTHDGERSLLRPGLWVRLRFPEWHCPPEERLDGEIDRQRQRGLLVPDPRDPGRVWTAKDDVLLRLPAADVPALPARARIGEGTRAERFPFPAGVRLRVGDVDDRFVWGWAYPFRTAPGGEAGFVFRFDKRTREYTLYPRTSVPPEHRYGAAMRSDGDTIWLWQESGAYRLDLQSNRFTLVLAPGGTGRPMYPGSEETVSPGAVAAIVPDTADPDAVYLSLREPVQTVYPGGPQPPILYRYRKSDKRLEPLPISEPLLQTPEGAGGGRRERPPAIIVGTGGLLAERDVLWVGTTAGVFRVEKRTGVWSRPELPAGTPPLTPAEIYREPAPAQPGVLWLRGFQQVLRLASPSAR